MSSLVIAPSLLSANFAHFGDDAKAVLDAGADWLHFDVMDNHFVPNLTFGAMFCKALRDDGITAPIDAHLMISPVESLIEDFAKAGATYITIHAEACDDIAGALKKIRSLGVKTGLALNPDTPVATAAPYIEHMDMLLIMSVFPGFGGQSFIPESLQRLQQARQLIQSADHPIRLQIDGGIKIDNVKSVVDAGADTIVAGSAIFGTDDYQQTISAFRHKIS